MPELRLGLGGAGVAVFHVLPDLKELERHDNRLRHQVKAPALPQRAPAVASAS
jgi:hypothetical protein